MKPEKIVLRKMRMALKFPFQTSFGTQVDRDFVIVELHAGDHVGYGECTVATKPLYNEETPETARIDQVPLRTALVAEMLKVLAA
ncbi:hypothetical protein [Kyrpidia sp.]|uniref:hypothetical protein n=1 Tax=Kyrpidia sp. TaxID=2073077 RepID=UPI00258EB3E3|nr:hypothetical protein [Kyrpidia sp.]MCL6575140.1 hypothetical protein [Kyrpidia sp.]